MAANNIKGITIEIGGDTTKLGNALKDVNSTISKTQKELKEVDKALNLDPGNVELLEQKQRDLAKAVEATSDKLKTLKEAQKQAAEQLAKGEIGQEQYDALTCEVVKTEKALENAKKAAQDFGSVKLQELSAELDKVSSKADKVASATKGISSVAAGVVGGIGAMAVKSAKTADELETLSQRSGLTTTELQRMQYASEIVDVSMDDMVGAQTKLRKSMAGTGEAFKKLGVVTTVNGQMRDSNEVFYETLEALSRVGNETERDQLAMEIFGRSADNLAGIIDDGGAALKELGDEAEDLGIVLDDETLNSMKEVADEIDKLKAKANGELSKAGASALQALEPVFDDVINGISRVLDWIGNLDSGTLAAIVTIGSIVAAISPVAGMIGKVTGAINGLMTVWPSIQAAGAAVSGFVAANPILLIAAAVVAAVAIIIANWDKIQPVLEEVWNKVKEIAEKIVEAVKGAVERVKNAIRAVKDALKNVWDAIVDGVKNAIQKVKDAFQSVKDFFVDLWTAIVDTVKEKVNSIIENINRAIEAINTFTQKVNNSKIGSALGMNIKQIGTIPALANGGQLWQGSALVGEAGAELLTVANGHATVRPLTQNTYNNYTTTNNYGSKQPQQINVNIDGYTAAQALYNPLQQVSNAHGPQYVK